MPLLKTVHTPTSAALSYHVVGKATVDLNSQHAVALLTVNSWPSEQSFIAAGGKMAAWEWLIPVPLAPLQESGPLIDICEHVLTILPSEHNPFEGASKLPAAADIETARARKWAQIKQTRTMLETQPVSHAGFSYDATPASQLKVMGAIQRMTIANIPTITWTLNDNTSRELTLSDLYGIGFRISDQIDSCFQIARQLREQINAATTVEEVEAISWPVQ